MSKKYACREQHSTEEQTGKLTVRRFFAVFVTAGAAVVLVVMLVMIVLVVMLAAASVIMFMVMVVAHNSTSAKFKEFIYQYMNKCSFVCIITPNLCSVK